jgi:hypothetical protein
VSPEKSVEHEHSKLLPLFIDLQVAPLRHGELEQGFISFIQNDKINFKSKKFK